LPAEDFRLYAVSTRYPGKLANQVKFIPAAPGIFDLHWGIRTIRVIVLSRIRQSEANAPWLMFSAEAEKVKYGAASYRWNSPVSSIINKLFKKYQKEGMAIMPYTIEDYQQEVKEEILKNLTEEDLDILLQNPQLEELVKKLKPEARMKGLTPDEIKAYLKKIDQKEN